MISQQHIDRFHEDGFLLLEGFYDPVKELLPLKRAIHRVVGLVIERYHPDIAHSQEPFDAGYMELIRRDRRLGGVVYDAVKQLPEFVQLVASQKNIQLMQGLRNSDCVGIARNGDGIRINNPHEPKYMAPWHQEFPSQFRSLDGAVFWAPLHDIATDMGPVELCIASHKEGVRTVYYENPEMEGTAYGLALWDEGNVVEPYAKIAPLTKEGDLLLIDFLTLHRSGYNNSDRARWSMQLRYFNFHDSLGREIDWKGGFQNGLDIAKVMPDILKKGS